MKRARRKPVLWVIEWRENGKFAWRIDRVILHDEAAAKSEARRAAVEWAPNEFRVRAYVRRGR